MRAIETIMQRGENVGRPIHGILAALYLRPGPIRNPQDAAHRANGLMVYGSGDPCACPPAAECIRDACMI